MLQETNIGIDLGQGVDTKTDPKVVVPGKMLALKDAVFTTGKRVQKRNGYTALTKKTFSPIAFSTGTLAAPKMIKAYNNETLCQDSGRLYSYSSSLGAWIDKGPYNSVEMSQQGVSSSPAAADQTFQTSCLFGNYLVLGFQQNDFGSTGGPGRPDVYTSVIDITNGTKVYGDKLVGQGNSSSNPPAPRAVLLGGSVPAIVYIDNSRFPSMRTLTISSNQVQLNGAVTIFSTISQIIDVWATATGGAMLLNVGGTSLQIKTFDTTGTITHTATIAGILAFPVKLGTLCVGSNGYIWAYWPEDSGGGYDNVYYAVYDSTLSLVLARTNGYAGNVSIGTVDSLVAVSVDANNQQLLVTTRGVDSGQSGPSAIDSVNLTSGGVKTTFTFKSAGVQPISRIFTYNTHRYVYVVETSGQSSSVFLMDLDASPFSSAIVNYTGLSVGKALTGETPVVPDGTAISNFGVPSNWLSDVTLYSSNKYSFHCSYISGSFSTNASVEANVFTHSSTLLFSDFASSNAYIAKGFANEMILNGGIPALYDGQICAELNFNTIPIIYHGVVTSTGGNMGDGTYLYQAVFQWVDNQGSLHQSAPSETLSVTVSSGTGTATVALYVSIPFLTNKDPTLIGAVSVAIFRTVAAGSNYFETNSRSTPADPTAGGMTIVNDIANDTQLIKGLPIYTAGGVVENGPPPPAMLFASHNNRMWAVDSTNPNNLAYTKTDQRSFGISFSPEFSYQANTRGTAIGAIEEMDDKLVAFKQVNAIVAIYGDGANDQGQGSTLTAGQFVQTDVGCQVAKSVFSTPQGLMFKSPKGWYLLDRSLGVSYQGWEVEAFNSQDVTSIVRSNNKTLIIILTSSGYALAYDYFYNQWSQFTNHTGYGADACGGLYTYARTDGSIYQENTTTYLDNTSSYAVSARLSWLKLGQVQGFQRVRRFSFLGDQLSSSTTGHGVQVSYGYDFNESSIGNATPFYFTTTGGVVQYRERVFQQKCDSITLQIDEIVTGQSGEFIDFTDLAFEAGIKKGINKLGSTQTLT